jgi:GNAT superfamily N-acetyltransferase
MDIRALRPSDDRSSFRSGDETLDLFLRKYAAQNQFRHHLGVTWVAVEGRRILGFATVAPGQLEIERLPIAARRKLPRYPLPVLRLARLAVDRSAQKQGVGAALLRFSCELAVRLSEDYGCIGIAVDAKPDAVAFYSRYGFVTRETLEGQSLAHPRPKLMFLALGAIKAATGL